MILQVLVSKELISQWFTTGFELRGTLTVKEGLPAGAKLIGARMGGHEEVMLLFEAEGLPGEPDRAVNIVVQRDRELADLEESLAFANAVISINCCAIDGGDGWLRLSQEDAEDLADELRYLELRGQLERHATDPLLIQLSLDAADAVKGDATPEVPR